MTVSLQRTISLVALVFVLLLGLLGWSITSTIASLMLHHSPGIHAIPVQVDCPPPPREC